MPMITRAKLFVLIQNVLPQHLLSRAIGLLADARIGLIKAPFIHIFKKHFNVELQEAERENVADYKSFNDFFTRALKPSARPIDTNPTYLCSPADGVVSQAGKVAYGRVIQAKGKDFSLLELLGGNIDLSTPLQNGDFATIYLSPKDYHRVHMPIDGRLTHMLHVPGRLFSVNQSTTEEKTNLFSRNERVVCFFETRLGPVAVVLVGAMIVGSIETVWAGQVTPKSKNISVWDYEKLSREGVHLKKGDELGRFKLGSTVIIVTPKDQIQWLNLKPQTEVHMGEKIASIQGQPQLPFADQSDNKHSEDKPTSDTKSDTTSKAQESQSLSEDKPSNAADASVTRNIDLDKTPSNEQDDSK